VIQDDKSKAGFGDKKALFEAKPAAAPAAKPAPAAAGGNKKNKKKNKKGKQGAQRLAHWRPHDPRPGQDRGAGRGGGARQR
jgi:hypothetical protein